MAGRWRLRHKLLLGLALVLASFGLLLLGTVRGLTAFDGTINSTDSRLIELLTAQDVKKAIEALTGSPSQPGGGRVSDPDRARAQLDTVRTSFATYEQQYAVTLGKGRDADSEQENRLIGDIRESLDGLAKALDEADVVHVGDRSRPLTEDPGVRAVHEKLVRQVDQLIFTIAFDIYQGFGSARAAYNWSVGVILAACAVGALFLFLLGYLFRRWVFSPIKLIQAGVQRVSNADFDHPIRLDSGDELAELAGAFNEMTRRLREIYQDLARQVNERSRQLVRSERMVSVGFLAAGVAHEINNPLASIAFCSEALERRVSGLLVQAPGEAEDIRKYLTMIQQEAFRCKEITSRLLEFSRVGERRREPTDLAGLVQSVLEIARHLQNCRGKRIIFHPLGRPVAAVNAQDLKSVVLNLVVNALDSMDEGGTLRITLRPGPAFAEMEFADTGCGMAPEVLQNLFEPFFTRSRTGRGTGLGLFISHQIIDQHGGTIEAHSPGPGRGSTFTVRVPLQAAEAEAPTLPVEESWARPAVMALPAGRRPASPDAPEQTEDGFGHAAA